jgi:hypothetical protein
MKKEPPVRETLGKITWLAINNTLLKKEIIGLCNMYIPMSSNWLNQRLTELFAGIKVAPLAKEIRVDPSYRLRVNELAFDGPVRITAGNGNCLAASPVAPKTTAAEVGDYKMSSQPSDHHHWLLCDGRSLKPADYPLLFQTIGTQFGGDNDHFMLPDAR